MNHTFLRNMMDNSLESEIIETTHHLTALITMYGLVTNPQVEAYYSDLCGRLERFASIIERSKQNTRKREIDCASGVIISARKLQNRLAMYNAANTVNKDYYYIDFYDKLENFIDRVKNENMICTDFQDTLNDIKDNKKKVETVNQKLSEYMKTLKDFYGELTIKTLKDNYEDSFEIKFFTDKIDDNIISTLEKYKDYEVYDVRCEQYCSLPPIDCRIIYLDNRKVKPW